MAYKYKLSEMSKTGTIKQAEKEFDSPYETFRVGQVNISDDGQRKSEIVDIDSETGQVSWKITQLPGFDKLYDELTDLVSTAKRTYVKTKDDIKFREFYDEIRDIRNKVRTHLRNEYPDQYKRIVMEEEVDEISMSGAAGAYNTPYAFRLKKKKQKDIVPEVIEGTCGYDRDNKGKKLKGPGGLGEAFKVGQKVTYLGNPAEITLVDKDNMDRVYYNVLYDKGTGKTKASNIYNKDGEIKAIKEVRQLVHVYDKDGSIYGTGEIVGVEKDKTLVRFDGHTVKRFPDDRVKPVREGDTYEKMAAKGKKAGSLKQGTVRKRLGIKKGEKIPLSLINKELSRLKKMDKDDDKKGVQLGDKNQKYYKALQLSKTLKTTTNVNELDQSFSIGDELTLDDKKGKVIKVMDDMLNVDFGNGNVYGITLSRIKGNEIFREGKNPGATLGPGPKAGPDGVTDSAYTKQFKYKLVPKNKKGTYVQKGSGLDVKKLF